MRHADYWKSKLDHDMPLPKEFRLPRSRIMYIEAKSEGLEGDAVIGRVYFSKSGKLFITRVCDSRVRKAPALRPTTLKHRAVISFGYPDREKIRMIACMAETGMFLSTKMYVMNTMS